MVEISKAGLSKRVLFKYLAATTATAILPSDKGPKAPQNLDYSKLGLNLNLNNAIQYGYTEKDVFKMYETLPNHRVRVPIRMSDVCFKPGVYDFSIPNRHIDAITAMGKAVDPVVGIKTPEYPEIHVPGWLYKKFPYLEEEGCQLDADSDFQQVALDFYEAVGQEYRYKRNFGPWHIENEGHFRKVYLANYRYVSPEFTTHERQVLGSILEGQQEFIQNIDISEPTKLYRSLQEDIGLQVNIVGLNVYPNSGTEFSKLKIDISLANLLARFFGKKLYITELGLAPWREPDGQIPHKFSWQSLLGSFEHLLSLGPDLIYFWDYPYVYMAADEMGDRNYQEFKWWLESKPEDLSSMPKLRGTIY